MPSETQPAVPYRVLGSTGESVSAIGVGGWHLGLKKVDEKLAIRIVEIFINHRLRHKIEVDRHTRAPVGVSCRGHGPNARNKGQRLSWVGNGTPTKLSDALHLGQAPVRGLPERVVFSSELPRMEDRWTNPVEP